MKCAENWEQKKPMQNFDFMIQKEFDNEDEELKELNRVGNHLRILVDAGLLVGSDESSMRKVVYFILGITLEGYAVIPKLKDPVVTEKTKSIIGKVGNMAAEAAFSVFMQQTLISLTAQFGHLILK